MLLHEHRQSLANDLFSLLLRRTRLRRLRVFQLTLLLLNR